MRIRRDPLGVPTVEAKTSADLFFGQGLATAQDRLWQLEWDRRRALGRTAELIGSAANVVTDGFNRRVRLGDAAKAGYQLLDNETQAILDAHAAGINEFQQTMPAPPVEFQALGCAVEPWHGWHAIAIFLVRHVTFATWQTKLWNARVLAALGVDSIAKFRAEGDTGDAPIIVPSGTRAAIGALEDTGLFDAHTGTVLDSLRPLGLQQSGSNAWAVHGRRTASGKPLIAGDPHRPFEVPNVYYQVRLVGPDIDAAGFSFPGVPGILHFAQTPHVAWAVTNAMADYQDLFIERFPESVTDSRNETIVVRGGADVHIDCLTTRHGPVVLGGLEQGVGVALQSTGLIEAGGSLRTIMALLTAKRVADIDVALADWVEPANNFVFADTAGDIAYRTAGRIPLRHELNAVLPVPGWDEAFDWDGYIPFSELPFERNPPLGAIVTANQRVTNRNYPYRLNYDAAPPHRAERIWTRLGDRVGLTPADQAVIHADTVSLSGLHLADWVRRSGGPAAALLDGWDGTMAVDSAPAALVGQIRHELCRVVTATLPASLRTNPFSQWEPPATAAPTEQRVATALAGWLAADDTTVLKGRQWAALVDEATNAALQVLAERCGPDPTRWRWGLSHEATPLHPARHVDELADHDLRPTSGPVGGATDCVMATNQIGGVTTNALGGSTARYVWDLADRTNSQWIVPLGASGDPSSPHFADQTADWTIGALQPVFSTELTENG